MPRFKQRESKIQANVKKWAEKTWGDKQKGFMSDPSKLRLVVIKLTMLGMMGQAGWPDLAFFPDTGSVFFIEMKKPGKIAQSTPLQRFRQALLRLLGFSVYVCDSEESAKKIVSEKMLAKRAATEGGARSWSVAMRDIREVVKLLREAPEKKAKRSKFWPSQPHFDRGEE